MNTKTWRKIGLMAAAVAFLLAGPVSATARDKGKDKQWRVPVLMEEATVRGKVVVLETRREDRKAVENLLVQVWTVPDEQGSSEEAGKTAKAAAANEEPAEPAQGTEESGDSKDAAQANPDGEDKPKLVHETRTDENGLFSLPVLSIGAYTLVVGEINVELSVIPKAEERKDQEEPKILLILLPKEVVS